MLLYNVLYIYEDVLYICRVVNKNKLKYDEK